MSECIRRHVARNLDQIVMTAHETALLRNSELVAQIEQDLADPSKAAPSSARRPKPE